jgi:PAS domain S-box-containing protein
MMQRIRMPLASRMTLTFGALILVMAFAVSVVVDQQLARSGHKQLELRVAALTHSLSVISAPYLMSYDYVTLQQIADDALREPDVSQVVILDKEGLIAGMSGSRGMVGQRAEDPISLRGQIADQPFSVEELAGDDDRLLVRVEPVVGSDGQTRWGSLRIAMSLRGAEGEARAVRADVLVFALIGFLLAFGASHLLARRITRHLGRLVEGAEGLARGEWDSSLRIRTGDELEVLADRFRQTADSLERQRRDLIRARDETQRLNATLEQNVEDRTAQLVESQEKYRLLVEASPDLLCLVQQGRFRFVNRTFLETFGLTEEQVTGNEFSIDRVVHPDFARAAMEALDHIERTGEPIDADWVGVGRGGRALDFEVRGHRVTYQGEPAVELLWVDLTDKKHLLRQLVQNERLRAIGEMTAMVAHNFNNLLAVILGRTQLILARTDNPTVRRGLEIVRNSALQGGEIVKRIQEYAGGSSDLPFREVNAGTILRDVTAYLENLWRVTRSPGAGPVQIELSIEPTPPVIGSETLLADVLKHILLNAAESMPGGGIVRASVRALRESIVIRVEDSGVGMAPDVRRRAFDPFFTTKGPHARGLGLSASYGIVQRHRGRIDLHPREEGGTSVEIILPVHRASRPATMPGIDSRVVFRTEEQESARRLLQGLRDHAGRAGRSETEDPPDEARVA